MKSSVSLSCFSNDNGGATLEMESPEVAISLPLDHAAALKTAASILLCAGVRRATFKDGALREGAS